MRNAPTGRALWAGAFAVRESPEQARKAVDRLADEHVRLPDGMTPEIYGALVDEAKKRVPIAPPCTSSIQKRRNRRSGKA